MKNQLFLTIFTSSTLLFGCKKWVEEDLSKQNLNQENTTLISSSPLESLSSSQESSSRESSYSQNNILTGEEFLTGKLHLFIHNIKEEEKAWFKNCIKYKAKSENFEKEEWVGCNKKDPTGEKPFLQKDKKYEHLLPKDTLIHLGFFIHTWEPQNNTRTEFTPNPQREYTFSESKASFRCLKIKEEEYMIYFEDQPDLNHKRDLEIRQKLGNIPLYDPVNKTPSSSQEYPITEELLKELEVSHKCLYHEVNKREKEARFALLEKDLQACYGIDFQDLIVKVSGEDVKLSFGVNDDYCK